ncbi:hypothetical protein FRC10_007374 [Ceratobasidium sp. 414]|nr:hypothetical protein FRC10_007374 [Ceratobasidium sp. 414]
MSAIGTRTTEVIDLAEDSETLSVMLAYIYPSGVPPPLGSFGLLEKSLEVAQKYDLKAILERLDRALSTESSYKELIQSDPLRTFHLSVTYGLQQSQTVAIREVQPKHCDLSSINDIVQLAKVYPGSSHVIALMGVQAARAEILFRFFYNPICWAPSLYESFIDAPSEDHSHLFTLGMFNTLIYRPCIMPFCKLCVKVALKAKNGQVLEAWLRSVKDELEDELKELEVLFTL